MPSTTSTSQINEELGLVSTTTLLASDTKVKRIAGNLIEDTYVVTGSTVTVTVPTGTTNIRVYMWGGGGGSFRSGTARATGGGGAFIYALIPLNGATTFTYVVGAGGANPSGQGGFSRLTVNGISYTAGGATGGTSLAAGTAGSVSYPGGEANVIFAQNGFNGFRTIGGATSLDGGNAGGQAYGGGQGSLNFTNRIPGAGAFVSTNVTYPGARGEIRIVFEKSSLLSWSQLRYGLNFPARKVYTNSLPFVPITSINTQPYDTDSKISLTDDHGVVGAASDTATVSISINSAGQLSYFTLNGPTFTRTWLTAGAGTAAEYTANLIIHSGTLSAGSSATSSELVLSTNRLWILTVTTTSVATAVVYATLIIKRNSVEIMRRNVYMYVGAQVNV
jgi:hypothetical protein